MAASIDQSTRYQDTAFIGHPRGLGWLSFTEFWERFSYYGMQALLVLYMTHYLLLPGHVENVAGFETFRGLIEGAYGNLSPQALASAIFGLYAGLVYLTPIAGGILADRVLGRTMAVTIGACLMALGHFLMAFEVSFLAALLCLLIGVGCFKGNIATQVGELYAPGDLRRADAFQIYMLGIQAAVILSPIVCGTLGEVYGWHWGFGAAGVGMVIGLTIYLFARPWLPPEQTKIQRKTAAPRAPLTRKELTTVLVLLALVPVLTLSAVGNQQIFNAYLIWGEAHFDMVFFGQAVPTTWLVSLDAIFSSVTMIIAVIFWRWWGTFKTEPNEITKIFIGTSIAAVAPLCLMIAASIADSTGERVSLFWAIAFEFFNDFGFANVFPVGLALFSRAAPKNFGGMMLGIYYLHLFMCNMLVGYLGGLLEKMSGTSFWGLHAGLIGIAALILLLARTFAGAILAPGEEGKAV